MLNNNNIKRYSINYELYDEYDRVRGLRISSRKKSLVKNLENFSST